ncbi:MAG TPA: D-erythronate dehydrogenase [Hyphomicrobiaceae bacterium]|jgi:nucleoside-diphosphate-sugar epimerase|nr:D-erythronate dehydrogenase [Hyphomicrobiaceae bacterium]
MNILIIGGAGMIGRKLAERLARDGELGGKAISSLALYDVAEGAVPAAAKTPVKILTGDLPAAGEAGRLVGDRPDVVFHLAAIVSGEAEQDFDKGYRINMDGTRALLEAVRRAGYAAGHGPRVVFTSSIAVFGAPFPEAIGDEFFHTPLTSYGTQKAICELLVSDYTRKGFLDGLSIRLPTVCVRPGAPNKAASGFFSNIIREPLAGKEAVLPVAESVMHWHASPRAAVEFLRHAATLDAAAVGPRRALTMPGLAVTVAEQIAALRKVAGDKVADRIRREPDPFVERIVAGWPRRFDARRALALGFKPDASFEEIVRIHVEDELGGRIA